MHSNLMALILIKGNEFQTFVSFSCVFSDKSVSSLTVSSSISLTFSCDTGEIIPAPQFVGLLWKCDQLIAGTSTSLHTTPTTDRHPCPIGIGIHNIRRRAAVDLRLRTRGHWDLLCLYYSHIHLLTLVKKSTFRLF